MKLSDRWLQGPREYGPKAPEKLRFKRTVKQAGTKTFFHSAKAMRGALRSGNTMEGES